MLPLVALHLLGDGVTPSLQEMVFQLSLFITVKQYWKRVLVDVLKCVLILLMVQLRCNLICSRHMLLLMLRENFAYFNHVAARNMSCGNKQQHLFCLVLPKIELERNFSDMGIIFFRIEYLLSSMSTSRNMACGNKLEELFV